MENYSAILEMHRGKRGDSQQIKYGDEYRKSLREYATLAEEFHEKIKDYPELFDLWKKCEDASNRVNVYWEEDQYREGFQFGLLMGLEAGMSAMK